MQVASRKTSVSRDFILLFAVLMVIIIAVALWVAYTTFENYTEAVVKEMESEAVRIDRSLIVEIKTASYILESLARQIIQTGPENHDKIARLLSSFYDSNNTRNDEYAWLDANQDIIINSSSGVLENPINSSDRDYVKKSLAAPWQVHIGRPVTGRFTKKWILPVSLGVTDYQGNFVGIIMLSIDIQKLSKELETVVQSSGMEFSIFTPTMILITDSNQLNNPSEVTQNTVSLTQKDIAAQESGLLSKPYLFSPSIPFAYYESSTQYPYIIYITYNQVDNQDRIFSLLQARMLQIFLISIFLLLLLWMVRTRIIHPVEKLCEITAAIATGKPFKPLPRGGPLEIEMLAGQIRKLSDYINEQQRVEVDLKLKNQFLTKLKETAEMLTNVRSEFLLNVAHEMHKPLSKLHNKLYSLLEHEHKSSHKSQQHLEAINESLIICIAMQQMLEDMRFIAKSEYSMITLRDTSVNVSFAIHRAVRQFHDMPQYRHIEVKLKIDESLPPILIDEDRFAQIIVNILCGTAATIVQGTPIDVTAQLEFNEHISKELVIQVKYAAHHLLPTTELLSVKELDVLRNPADSKTTQRIRSDVICFALARMLVSLYHGEMTIGTTKNEMNRVFLRFPKTIITE